MDQIGRFGAFPFIFKHDSEEAIGPFPKMVGKMVPTRAFLLGNSCTYPEKVIFFFGFFFFSGNRIGFGKLCFSIWEVSVLTSIKFYNKWEEFLSEKHIYSHWKYCICAENLLKGK